MKKHVKFDENYFLVSQEVNNNQVIEVTKSVNHIIIIDVSGSMSRDLPEIRKNLKNKISSMVKPNDTVTIIWFSGRNEAGILKEEVSVNSLKQLNELNDAIDRFLKPIGLTAFAKPLELANEVIERIHSNNSSSIFSLIFMSDGYNNNCEWSDVVKALKQISPKLSSSTIVEYGWYADSRRLSEITGILGGEKIDCSGFEDYDIIISRNLSKNVRGGKKIVVDITDKYLYDFAFSVAEDGSVILYNITDNKITVGADVKEIYFFSTNGLGGVMNVETPLYAAIYILSEKLLSDDAEKIFYALGDNHYYAMLVNAFGKQKLNAFKSSIKECVADASKRFVDGRGAIKKVDENAYCLMNLINDLGNIKNCLFYPNHPSFNYSRIGRKRVAKGSELSDAEKTRLAEAKNVEDANKILAELAEKNVDLKFETTDKNTGYPVTDLVWNEERANLSIRIRIDGKVKLPSNKYGIDEITSYKYNTFTLVKDGIVNVEKLPVSYSDELYQIIMTKGLNADIDNVAGTIILDLKSLPIVNKSMVKAISANELAKLEWNLLKCQAEKKVYDYFRKIISPKVSKSFLELFADQGTEKAAEIVAWLKDIGITDYNGFAPKVVLEESIDFYIAVLLSTKIKGYSSLPKVEDVIAKIKDNKPFKPTEQLMSKAIIDYQNVLESNLYKSFKSEPDAQKKVLSSYLINKSSDLNIVRKETLQNIANIKFSLILSKKWFNEFKTFDENKLSLKLDNTDLDFIFDLTEEEVKI